MGAAIAQWIRLRPPSCRPVFESHAHHQCFYQLIFDLCHVEKTKINKKSPGLAHFFKKVGIGWYVSLFCSFEVFSKMIPLVTLDLSSMRFFLRPLDLLPFKLCN